MAERYKIGLTRNRLFEFDNAVVFSGKLPFPVEGKKALKTIKAMGIKEPVITSVVEKLGDDAFLVTEKATDNVFFSNLTSEEIKEKLCCVGLNYKKALFEFYFSCDGFIIIAGHTVACDGKALLRLALDFLDIYKNGTLTLDESPVISFPETNSMPVEVFSPIIDKISAELDSKWQSCKKEYSREDYLKSFNNFASKRSKVFEIKDKISSAEVNTLKAYCKAQRIDFSSLIAYAFFVSLKEDFGGAKIYNKILVSADRRFFFHNAQSYRVGAFSGFAECDIKPKELKLPEEERLKTFHLNCYKAQSSAFRTFYDDVLLFKVSGSFTDSAYMVLGNEEKKKISKRLCKNYSCGNEKLCEAEFYNLDQEFWKELKSYSQISVFEPFYNRFSFSLNSVLINGECVVSLKCREDKCTRLEAEKVFQKSISTILNFKN